MNRRNFLHLASAALPAAALAQHLGMWERVRSYFFAPATLGGWFPGTGPIDYLEVGGQTVFATDWEIPLGYVTALQLEKVRSYLPLMYDQDDRLFKMLRAA